ncbi:GntR family transcriptional regulator [Rossellomorea vietnamensis]|uniref:GntR family transcriptional regulator n=1 Tax=Rossellomorea vietnamensis TaxID=218284 RepID=UPI001E52C10D|nr:GntR family transcriptional regulator [Rossellomorea vietnamensis]MCC5801764.1 GntR family transcriptional regulator [Rossellomorea vietnamensis]
MTQTINKDIPIPLYYQLKEILKDRIKSGDLRTGELIPSERELVEQYEISRPTVRQAVNELVSEGLLRKEHGKGTYVAKPKISQWFLENLTSFSDEMVEKGLEYSTKVLKKTIVSADSTLVEIFGDRYKSYYRLDRLRFVKNEPYVLVTTYLPVGTAEDLLDEDFENASLYKTLEAKYGLNIGYADRVIEAVNVTEEDAKHLGVDPMHAVQLITTKGFLEDDQLFEYSIARYRGDTSNFTIRVSYKSR